MKKNLFPFLTTIMFTLLCGANIYAQETAEELAKKTQNPVADLVHAAGRACGKEATALFRSATVPSLKTELGKAG